MRFNIFKKRNLFSPSREFHDNAKKRFLAAFDARYGTAAQPATAFRFMFVARTATVALVVAMAAFGSASVYADTANVPADNPLYSLKRLSESVKLAVATQAQVKTELEASFAARRANEIADLEKRSPDNSAIARLTTDLDDSFNASIEGVEKPEREAEPEQAPAPQATGLAAPQAFSLKAAPDASASVTASSATTGMNNSDKSQSRKKNAEDKASGNGRALVCTNLKAVFGVSSSIVRSRFSDKSEGSARVKFEERCGKIEDRDGGDSTFTGTSTVGVTSTINIPAPIKMPSRDGRKPEDNRGGLSGSSGTGSGSLNGSVTTSVSSTTGGGVHIEIEDNGKLEL